jgi:hypothetical protein
MTKLKFQTIVQFSIDTETNQVEILKKFTTPFGGSQDFKKKAKQPKPMLAQEAEEEWV